jgi:hypothetical protein
MEHTHRDRFYRFCCDGDNRSRATAETGRKTGRGAGRARGPCHPCLQLARLPRLIRRLHLTWRPRLIRRLRLTPRRASWPGPPAGRRRRPWHDTRRRREPLRLRRSNSRKLPAAAAGVERDSPNRPSLVRATMRRAHPRRRAPRRRWALRRRALRQQRTSDALGPRSKM